MFPLPVSASPATPRPHFTLAHLLAGGLVWLTATIAAPGADAVTLAPGEHVAIIGNALADRMQHHGWLETMIHAQHPQHRLVVRNLAFSGDEVAVRPRSQDFGTPDQWLTRVQASTIFAFFGFNESFRGAAGLPQFKQELEQFLRDTRAKNYNGLGPPRIVLFSPIANENHPNPDLRLPLENNANLALYTAAMAEVARDLEGVTFVDLFKPSQQLFAAAAQQGQPPLTFNGVHLTEAGEAKLANVMFPALFGGTRPPEVPPALRAAVNAKNTAWHLRYRSLDGYNTFGGRSQNHLYFGGEGRPKITNAQVLQEEFAQRDVITANRDLNVWSVAQGRGAAVEELPLPPVTPVPTSKPGTNPDGSHVFLGAEDAIAKMTLHPGLQVNLFASEVQFPELRKPVQMAWDTRGRLWVATWPNYPLRRPDSKEGDRLLILEDTNGDGRADRCTTFLDDLDSPTGFQFYKDGVLLVQAPDLWYIRDTDGDGRADQKERVLMGLDSADTHHQANSLSYDPGGAIYLSDGVFHRTQVETAEGPVRNLDAAIYRYEPRTQRFETYVAYGFANPHGRSFDRWGNDLITDATGNRTFFGPAFSGRIDYPAKHPTLKPFWPNPSRPSAASTILTSRHFPDDFQGNFLNGNVIRFQGVYRVKIVDDGAGYKGEQQTDFLSSSDPNFRPTGIDTGPDGAVYLLDWHSPIIAHTNLNHLRDPNRGFEYGRIYRISHRERPLLSPPKIHGQPVAALLELLKEPEARTRELAKIELDRHDRAEVMAALKAWIGRLDARHPDYQHHLMEALWVHQWQNVVDVPLLERMLRSPEPEARAAATRVLGYWRDRVPQTLALLRTQAADEHPRVRLHAVRAASFFRSTEAVEVALTAINRPLDYYLDYTLDATIRQLTPHWRDQLEGGGPLLRQDSARRIGHLLRTVTNDALLKLPRTREVLELILTRTGVPDSARAEALVELARIRKTTSTDILLGCLESGEKAEAPSYGRLLVAQPRADLSASRDRLAARALQAETAGRNATWAALVIADGGFDRAWPAAEKDPKVFADLLTGIPMLSDAALRATAFPRLRPLIDRAPGQPALAAPVRQAAIRAAVSTRQEMTAQFQAFSRLIQLGEEIPVAAEGMRGLARANWTYTDAGPLAQALVAWAKKTPEASRRGAGYLGVAQLAEELSGKLPAAEATALRKELLGLRSASFLVRAVPEEMRFDVPRLVAEVGKAFTIVFENPDAMPHNLVVVKPGTREKVGQAALELRADFVDRLGRAFVPETSDVIAATKLLDPGQSATIRVDAPLSEGEYEYVCTFPGHWVTMWGKLIITSNPDAVLAAPAAPAAPGAASGGHQHGTR
jgi:glucose/arabinose dehydrogenase/azurin/lysophospholipase L1-like esterase